MNITYFCVCACMYVCMYIEKNILKRRSPRSIMLADIRKVCVTRGRGRCHTSHMCALNWSNLCAHLPDKHFYAHKLCHSLILTQNLVQKNKQGRVGNTKKYSLEPLLNLRLYLKTHLYDAAGWHKVNSLRNEGWGQQSGYWAKDDEYHPPWILKQRHQISITVHRQWHIFRLVNW